ncbi:adenosylcobinamide amidohydrolase [Methylomarinum sp. Ch1-1]|uniref:Adenosylcobinamide amidohydrolase n=1 Tax=Methylomarinum roseum TaxID=3067653 RepID=A0AAU7NVP5_9GAMM|nr:adenosylcobinamide amidohydrolase [Methylomarinum sp. Ch1-1]MDP4522907.1 adenosylcobinamide amidohydrolase [Methylomarinum sp. Ch1-1]
MDHFLTKQISYQHTPRHLRLNFNRPHLSLSSAVLNGGLISANGFVNLKVDQSPDSTESPAQTLARYCQQQAWQGTTVGMMTAASMSSLRIAKKRHQNIDIVVMVTSGLSNPRRAGDKAEYQLMSTAEYEIGTINMLALTSATLTEAAMAEALMMATEAKTVVLHAHEIKSSISNAIATGTGTDSCAIVSAYDGQPVTYCGKHVMFGEILAQLVIEALSASIAWKSAR